MFYIHYLPSLFQRCNVLENFAIWNFLTIYDPIAVLLFSTVTLFNARAGQDRGRHISGHNAPAATAGVVQTLWRFGNSSSFDFFKL